MRRFGLYGDRPTHVRTRDVPDTHIGIPTTDIVHVEDNDHPTAEHTTADV